MQMGEVPFKSSQFKFIIPQGEIKLQSGIKKHITNDTTHKIINSNGRQRYNTGRQGQVHEIKYSAGSLHGKAKIISSLKVQCAKEAESAIVTTFRANSAY